MAGNNVHWTTKFGTRSISTVYGLSGATSLAFCIAAAVQISQKKEALQFLEDFIAKLTPFTENRKLYLGIACGVFFATAFFAFIAAYYTSQACKILNDPDNDQKKAHLTGAKFWTGSSALLLGAVAVSALAVGVASIVHQAGVFESDIFKGALGEGFNPVAISMMVAALALFAVSLGLAVTTGKACTKLCDTDVVPAVAKSATV